MEECVNLLINYDIETIIIHLTEEKLSLSININELLSQYIYITIQSQYLLLIQKKKKNVMNYFIGENVFRILELLEEK